MHFCFCSDRLQNGMSDDEAMLTNFVVGVQCCGTVVDDILCGILFSCLYRAEIFMQPSMCSCLEY